MGLTPQPLWREPHNCCGVNPTWPGARIQSDRLPCRCSGCLHAPLEGPGVLALVGTRKGLSCSGVTTTDAVWRGPRARCLTAGGCTHATATRAMNAARGGQPCRLRSTVQRSSRTGRTWRAVEEGRPPREIGTDACTRLVHRAGTARRAPHAVSGGDPGAFFRSDDGGHSWEVNRGILDPHPHASAGFRGRRNVAATRSSSTRASRSAMYVGITAAGCFVRRTTARLGLPSIRTSRSTSSETAHSDVGQCPHKLLMHPAHPNRLWQQNHDGVFRSELRRLVDVA